MNVAGNDFLENIDMSPMAMGTYTKSYERFLKAADRYRSDEEFRVSIDGASGREVYEAFGFDVPVTDMQVDVVANTDDVVHFILPPDPNMDLADESLSAVSGGATAGSAGSVSTASTFQCSTFFSSFSTAGTAGTAGSAS